jgi:hypothetical protein
MLMKRLNLIFVGILLFSLPQFLESKIKVLHLTFHEGCKNDFEDVAKELNLDVTSWFVQALPAGFWEGFASGNEIYNVGHRRAERVWNRHYEFFNTFDVIITSDTAPLSRIFLQNNWEKPLIIWVCNRFDYAHGSGGEDRFPDREYYDLIKEATLLPNVRIISYTPFEHEYARRKGISFGTRTIKPLGKSEEELLPGQSLVPASVAKEETFFVFPRLDSAHLNSVLQACGQYGVKAWSGVYRGPEDLKGFKGVLFFPYAFSNLALFENLQRGVIHFVPTKRFLTELGFIRAGMHGNLDWSEWYFDAYKEYLIFFDSWRDLQSKISNIDYDHMKKKITTFGQQHRQEMIVEWRQLFNELVH